MNPIFSLKNFRSFGEDGADFELAPITVLTGCNSAGKSSLVKALMLLSGERRTNYIQNKYKEKLELSSKQLGLGGYKAVSHGDENIAMSYKIWSPDLQEELIVKREFFVKKYDVLNDGALYLITVEKLDGTIIFKAGPGWEDGHLVYHSPYSDVITDEFNRFYAVGCYMNMMRLLPIVEKREKEDGIVDSQDKRSVTALKIVKDRLEAAGVTEKEAALLWKEYNHETFKKVINAVSNRLLEKTLIANLSVITEIYDDCDLDIMKDEFWDNVVNEVCYPLFNKYLTYIDSASAQISRLYSVEDDNKMCNALRLLNNRIIDYNDNHDTFYRMDCLVHEPASFLNKWLKKFGIGDSMEVEGTSEGVGIMAYLHNGNNKRLLADEGYGITQLASLLLQIDNSIPLYITDSKQYPEFDLGIPAYAYIDYPRHTICVEEPEIHLHPKYQSLLADMFVEAYQKYNIHFIIETHSEYLIRKLQVMVADKENKLTANEVSLNYVEKNDEGVSHNRQIKIKEDGRLDGSFGTGFFDEAGGLSRQLFMLNDEQS